MDVQVKAGSLVRTMVDREISGMVGKIVSQLQSEMTSVVSDFLSAGISAAGMLKLEIRLAEIVRESARKILQWLVASKWGQVSFTEFVGLHGRPLGRLVVGKPSRWTNCSIQVWLPKGWPRCAHFRIASSSPSVKGVSTRCSQSFGLAIGHGDNSCGQRSG